MANGDITMTLLYTGMANSSALKTAVDGQNEGASENSGTKAEIIFIPMTGGQVAVWKKLRSE